MKVQELSEIHFKLLHTSSLQLCNHITLTKKYLPKKSTSQQQRQLGKRNLNLFGFIVYIDTDFGRRSYAFVATFKHVYRHITGVFIVVFKQVFAHNGVDVFYAPRMMLIINLIDAVTLS